MLTVKHKYEPKNVEGKSGLTHTVSMGPWSVSMDVFEDACLLHTPWAGKVTAEYVKFFEKSVLDMCKKWYVDILFLPSDNIKYIKRLAKILGYTVKPTEEAPDRVWYWEVK